MKDPCRNPRTNPGCISRTHTLSHYLPTFLTEFQRSNLFSMEISGSSMRRSAEEIAAGILKSCTQHRLTISQLMAVQNLCYKILMLHLRHLVSVQLVELESNGRRRFFSTTQRGVVALRCYRNAMGLLKGNSSNCPFLISLDSTRPEGSGLAIA